MCGPDPAPHTAARALPPGPELPPPARPFFPAQVGAGRPPFAIPVGAHLKQFEWQITMPGPDGKLGTDDEIFRKDDLHAGRAGTTHFPGRGWIRPVYLAILLSHTVLAAAIAPLVLVTLARGLRADFPRHARLARWTLPVWLYVSVTGVVIYVMLYRLSW